MSDLAAKPCPFCGANPRPALRRLGSRNAASFAVVCDGCRATGPLRPNAVSAVERWNASRSPEFLRAVIAKGTPAEAARKLGLVAPGGGKS